MSVGKGLLITWRKLRTHKGRSDIAGPPERAALGSIGPVIRCAPFCGAYRLPRNTARIVEPRCGLSCFLERETTCQEEDWVRDVDVRTKAETARMSLPSNPRHAQHDPAPALPKLPALMSRRSAALKKANSTRILRPWIKSKRRSSGAESGSQQRLPWVRLRPENRSFTGGDRALLYPDRGLGRFAPAASARSRLSRRLPTRLRSATSSGVNFYKTGDYEAARIEVRGWLPLLKLPTSWSTCAKSPTKQNRIKAVNYCEQYLRIEPNAKVRNRGPAPAIG